jgi:cytochrome c oxidase subunit 3
MFFLSLLSAFVVRSGFGGEWGSFPLPKILLFNTGILVVSSVTMEIARRRSARANRAARLALVSPTDIASLANRANRAGRGADASLPAASDGAAPWIWISLALGTVFLAGQVAAWRQLLGSGLSIGETPYASYLYMLTGVHAAHVIGGLVALAIAAAWPSTPRPGGFASGFRRENIIKTSTIYWHFLTVVWAGLFLFLAIWR